jgi:hypothetical protein
MKYEKINYSLSHLFFRSLRINFFGLLVIGQKSGGTLVGAQRITFKKDTNNSYLKNIFSCCISDLETIFSNKRPVDYSLVPLFIIIALLSHEKSESEFYIMNFTIGLIRILRNVKVITGASFKLSKIKIGAKVKIKGPFF